MAYNTKEGFAAMQEDAIRRVREMQKRSRNFVETQPDEPTKVEQQKPQQTAEKPRNPQNNQRPQQNYSRGFQSPFSQLFGSNLNGFNKMKNPQNTYSQKQKPAENKTEECVEKHTQETPEKSSKDLLGNILKDFQIDDEKLMLILLIYILYKNGSDFKLIAALGYLLL